MAKRTEQKKKIRERTFRIRVSPQRLDVFLERLGKRFKRIAEFEERAKLARFGRLAIVKSIITEEKMRILRAIKEKAPSSIYELAKFLGRDIKSVRQDLRQLAQVGFIRLERVKDKRRIQKIRPMLEAQRFNIVIDLV